MTTPPLAVVVKGWPRLTETFIAQELAALEATGLQFDIWSLRHPTDQKTHPLHGQVTAPIRYLPEYLRDEPLRVARAFGKAATLPGFEKAAAVYASDLARDDTANRRRRFGQACVMATELPPTTKGIYAHFLHTPASVARYAAIMRNLPWAYAAHAKDIWTSPHWELREKLDHRQNGASFGVTCTRFGAEHLRSLAAQPERVSLVYHGLDMSRFPAPPNRAPRYPSDPFHLLSVGRLVEKKGFDRLIDAFARLPDHLNWHWVHIGGGPLAAKMNTRAENAGLRERIIWRGSCDQPEVIAAMRAADLFVLPSRIAADGDRDGLPNVLMEAASQKLPILSTPVAAIPEFIESEVHGLLVDDTPECLAAAIAHVAQTPELGGRFAENAYQRLIDYFQMDPGITRLASKLRTMLAEGDK
ncbi:MAG: glycosyltransferase family 4 protein [Pseudomonadota bacterium]